jgi:hypothetical protein
VSGSIVGELVAIDSAKQFGAQAAPGAPQENLTLTRLRIGLAKTRFAGEANHFRVFQRAPQFLLGRHFAQKVDQDLPRFRRCVGGAHGYMIAVGGAGSSGLPAFLSGTWIM